MKIEKRHLYNKKCPKVYLVGLASELKIFKISRGFSWLAFAVSNRLKIVAFAGSPSVVARNSQFPLLSSVVRERTKSKVQIATELKSNKL